MFRIDGICSTEDINCHKEIFITLCLELLGLELKIHNIHKKEVDVRCDNESDLYNISEKGLIIYSNTKDEYFLRVIWVVQHKLPINIKFSQIYFHQDYE